MFFCGLLTWPSVSPVPLALLTPLLGQVQASKAPSRHPSREASPCLCRGCQELLEALTQHCNSPASRLGEAPARSPPCPSLVPLLHPLEAGFPQQLPIPHPQLFLPMGTLPPKRMTSASCSALHGSPSASPSGANSLSQLLQHGRLTPRLSGIFTVSLSTLSYFSF